MKLKLHRFFILLIFLLAIAIVGCDFIAPGEVVDEPEEPEPVETEPVEEPDIEPDYREVETLADFALWDSASGVWTFFSSTEIAEEVAISQTENNITFNLPVHERHYYMYTFEGADWELPPASWDLAFGDITNYDGIKIDFSYNLEQEVDSLILFYGQHDQLERIDLQSWNLPVEAGSQVFSKYVSLEPEAETYRLYLRIINSDVENSMLLESLKIIGCLEQ